MKKKLVSVLMCMAMGATLLAGCGSEEAADSSNTTAADAADADTAADSEAADASDAADAADAADGDVITIGFAQVGHESDWRTASTNSAQSIFSAENGYDLQFVDCDRIRQSSWRQYVASSSRMWITSSSTRSYRQAGTRY